MKPFPSILEQGTGDHYSALYARIRRAGYSIQGLAVLFGKSHNWVKQAIRHDPRRLEFGHLLVLAGLLGCTVQDIADIILCVGPETAQADKLGNKQFPEGFTEKDLKAGKVPRPGWLRE